MSYFRPCLSALVIVAACSAGEPPNPAASKVDLYGDPLPERAICRLGSPRFRHPGAVYAVAFSADGKWLAAASDGQNMVRVWERRTGKLVGEWRSPKDFGYPHHPTFSPDGKRVYAAGDPRTGANWFAWDVTRQAAVSDPLKFPGGSKVLGFSADRTEVVVLDGSHLQQWHLGEDSEVARYRRPEGESEVCALLGKAVIAAQRDTTSVCVLATCDWGTNGRVQLWETATGKWLHNFDGHKADCVSITFSPDGKLLATGDTFYGPGDGTGRGQVRLWDVASRQLKREITGTLGSVHGLTFTAGGRQLIVGADDVHIRDVTTGERVGEPLARSRSWRPSLSPDGRLLAMPANDGSIVEIWELASRRSLRADKQAENAVAVLFASDCRTIAVSREGSIDLYDLVTGRRSLRLSNPGARDYCVAFSRDGKRLASAGNESSTATIWDVSEFVNQPIRIRERVALAELEEWWGRLLSPNPAEAYAAVWQLVAARPQSVPFLAGKLAPAAPADRDQIEKLIAKLDSARFGEREAASLELERIGKRIGAQMWDAQQRPNLSAEQRRRLSALLTKWGNATIPPETLRSIRAVAALEYIGDDEAKKLLERLHRGDPAARLTVEAGESLERLKGIKTGNIEHGVPNSK